MAVVQIPNLPAAIALSGTEQIEAVQGGTSVRITVGQISQAMGSVALPNFSLQFNKNGIFGGSSGVTTDGFSQLSLGVQQTTRGQLVLANTAAGAFSTTLQSSNSASAAWTLTLPTTAGTANYVLATDGSGVTSWSQVSLTAGVAGVLPVANGGTGITSLGAGVATFLGTPTSANLAAAVTDETGTGALVFSSSPTIATPTISTSFTSPLHIGGTTASSTLTLQSTSGVGTSDSIVFKVGNNGATTAATFDTSGNLGIGTTSPGGFGKLAVIGTSGTTQAFIGVGSDGWAFNTFTSSTAYLTYASTTVTQIGFGSQQAIPLSFFTSNTERARIDSSGNLLVGTTSQVGSALTSISSGTATNTSYRPLSLQGGSRAIFGNRKTTSVSTTATVISSVNEWGNLVLVFGTDGTNRFCDLVLWSIGTGTVNTINSLSASGTPAARTYSQSSNTLKLAMASGTYSIHVVELALAEV